jgi:hypothetical protein
MKRSAHSLIALTATLAGGVLPGCSANPAADDTSPLSTVQEDLTPVGTGKCQYLNYRTMDADGATNEDLFICRVDALDTSGVDQFNLLLTDPFGSKVSRRLNFVQSLRFPDYWQVVVSPHFDAQKVEFEQCARPPSGVQTCITETILANVAVGKRTLQSSTLAGTGGDSSKAVDNDTDGDFSHGSVTHTDRGYIESPAGASGPTGQWWSVVGFPQDKRVDWLNIINRTDCCTERLSPYYVLYYSQPRKKWVTAAHVVDPSARVQQVLIGQSATDIVIRKENDDYLSLAEVQVIAVQ